METMVMGPSRSTSTELASDMAGALHSAFMCGA
jgi:hypothetical protein